MNWDEKKEDIFWKNQKSNIFERFNYLDINHPMVSLLNYNKVAGISTDSEIITEGA